MYPFLFLPSHVAIYCWGFIRLSITYYINDKVIGYFILSKIGDKSPNRKDVILDTKKRERYGLEGNVNG